MKTTFEATIQNDFYLERGEVHHQRRWELETAKFNRSVGEFSNEQLAERRIQQLLIDLPELEVMAPSLITKPAWIETPVRLPSSSHTTGPTHRIRRFPLRI